MTASQLDLLAHHHGSTTPYRSDASISPCRRYRYTLERHWGDGATLCWIMLNPSTANASDDDPTIRKCIGFAQRWGYDGISVVNLFAWRATEPHQLRTRADSGVDVIGPDNDLAIISAATRAKTVIAAWGIHGRHQGRDFQVWKLLQSHHVTIACLGLTKRLDPKHPLYVPYDHKPRVYTYSLPPGKLPPPPCPFGTWITPKSNLQPLTSNL